MAVHDPGFEALCADPARLKHVLDLFQDAVEQADREDAPFLALQALEHDLVDTGALDDAAGEGLTLLRTGEFAVVTSVPVSGRVPGQSRLADQEAAPEIIVSAMLDFAAVPNEALAPQRKQGTHPLRTAIESAGYEPQDRPIDAGTGRTSDVAGFAVAPSYAERWSFAPQPDGSGVVVWVSGAEAPLTGRLLVYFDDTMEPQFEVLGQGETADCFVLTNEIVRQLASRGGRVLLVEIPMR